MIRFSYITLLLIAGALISSLGGPVLLLIYVILCIDKVGFGTTQVQAMGIELTSFATIIMGLNFSIIPTFAYIMVVYPMLEFARGLAHKEEVGPEILTENFFEWVLAAIVWALKGVLTPNGVVSSLPIISVVFISLLAKDIALYLKELII